MWTLEPEGGVGGCLVPTPNSQGREAQGQVPKLPGTLFPIVHRGCAAFLWGQAPVPCSMTCEPGTLTSPMRRHRNEI